MAKKWKQKKWQISLVLMVLLLLTLACSLPFTGNGGEDSLTPTSETTKETADQAQSSQGDLRCEQGGYPCSYADASQEALEKRTAWAICGPGGG